MNLLNLDSKHDKMLRYQTFGALYDVQNFETFTELYDVDELQLFMPAAPTPAEKQAFNALIDEKIIGLEPSKLNNSLELLQQWRIKTGNYHDVIAVV